ncbi:MAG: hypothetical protein CFE32_14125 [Alphaproteobacteria bacterium PA3]|nr:MAG: hypothetical protein CFE32_14125 [Alphaproteobacteria bacterium PA3]
MGGENQTKCSQNGRPKEYPAMHCHANIFGVRDRKYGPKCHQKGDATGKNNVEARQRFRFE